MLFTALGKNLVCRFSVIHFVINFVKRYRMALLKTISLFICSGGLLKFIMPLSSGSFSVFVKLSLGLKSSHVPMFYFILSQEISSFSCHLSLKNLFSKNLKYCRSLEIKQEIIIELDTRKQRNVVPITNLCFRVIGYKRVSTCWQLHLNSIGRYQKKGGAEGRAISFFFNNRLNESIHVVPTPL